MFTKILLPIDFSEHSHRCLEKILELKKHGCRIGEVVLLHVIDDRIVKFTEEMFEDTIDDAYVAQSCQQDAQKKLDELQKDLNRHRITTSTMIKLGFPFSTILKVAEEIQPSIIIMGHRGHNLAEELLLGSVAEKVARKAKVSVLLVR